MWVVQWLGMVKKKKTASNESSDVLMVFECGCAELSIGIAVVDNL